jgi:hypothetical protein
MSLSNSKNFISKGGFWQTQHSGKVLWAESDDRGNIKELIDPLDMKNISREADFKIVFIKETDNPDSFTKTKRWFCQDCHIELRKDVSENIVLKFGSDHRYYISDLKESGFTCQIDIESSTDTIILQKSLPYLINATIAKEYLKIWSYGFGKVSQKSGNSGNNSDLEYFVTV